MSVNYINTMTNAAVKANVSENKVPQKHYLNIGTVETNENGESYFVRLPFGICLDTMPKSRFASENELVAKLIAMCDSLEPGTARNVKLICELRHRSDATLDVAKSKIQIDWAD